MIEVLNAKIKSASFGFLGYDILTFDILVDAPDGKYYKFGGYALDQFNIEADKRIPTKEGFECLVNTMNTVGVSEWKDLLGKYVRIKVERPRNDIFTDIYSIGNIMLDRWFDIKEFWDNVNEREGECQGGEPK